MSALQAAKAPMTAAQIAEVSGLSKVAVNRQLRPMIGDGTVQIVAREKGRLRWFWLTSRDSP